MTLMSKRLQIYAGAYGASFALFAGMFFVRSLPPTIELLLYLLMLPGLLAAAIPFPTGIHSDYGEAYIWLSVLLNVALYGFLLQRILDRVVMRSRRSSDNSRT